MFAAALCILLVDMYGLWIVPYDQTITIHY